MNKIAHPLTFATVTFLLSVTSTGALADSTGCNPSDKEVLHDYLHRAGLHPIDSLSNYSYDLSAYGSRSSVDIIETGVQADSSPGDDQAVRDTTTRRIDLEALRAYFHSDAFHSVDGLDNYVGSHD